MSAEIVDYLVNAFTPDRRAVWERAVGDQGVPLKVVRDEHDDFADPAAMVQRMDELGMATLVLPTGDLGPHPAYDVVATRSIHGRARRCRRAAIPLLLRFLGRSPQR